MKQILDRSELNPRASHDGWALRVVGAIKPLRWTTCTTREECRELRREWAGLMRHDIEIVKVKLEVVVV